MNSSTITSHNENLQSRTSFISPQLQTRVLAPVSLPRQIVIALFRWIHIFILSPTLRCEDPSLYSDPEDMITVAHLYCVSLAFRLAIGGVSIAIASGLVYFSPSGIFVRACSIDREDYLVENYRKLLPWKSKGRISISEIRIRFWKKENFMLSH